MTTHTPGPWRVQGKYLEGGEYAPGMRLLIGVINSHRFGSADRVPKKDEQDANARLIAAAPRMLDALREIDAWYDLIKQNYPEMVRPFTRARALLREIEGR